MFDPDKREYTVAEITANRTLWIEGLESGGYTQAQGALYDSVGNGYCCLGVACKVLGVPLENNHFLDDGGTLPHPVQLALGMHNDDGGFDNQELLIYNDIGQQEGLGAIGSLVELNDSYGWNFSQIATLLRNPPEGLFKKVPEPLK